MRTWQHKDAVRYKTLLERNGYPTKIFGSLKNPKGKSEHDIDLEVLCKGCDDLVDDDLLGCIEKCEKDISRILKCKSREELVVLDLGGSNPVGFTCHAKDAIIDVFTFVERKEFEGR